MTTTSSNIETFIEPTSELDAEVRDFVQRGIDLESEPAKRAGDESFWRDLCDVETELWLDTGDFEAIEPLWNARFSGLTTNNSLLNTEVQKGTYDDLVRQAGERLASLDDNHRVREIAFILNTRHALRLVESFRCPVSVELHTDLAHDSDATVAYARRCHVICPDYFVVKVPLTPAGLVAIKQLRSEDIPVNCTLGFSARQNYVATAIANPSYVNVFLGRLNSYIADNDLGDGDLVGEKATIESQREVNVFARGLPTSDTRQIAASLRGASQLPGLAGVDVITMPPNVAKQAREELSEPWQSRVKHDYDVELAEGVDPENVQLGKLWNVSKQERAFVQQIILRGATTPQTPESLVNAAHEHGIRDLFPQLSAAELEIVADGGKIPEHDRWAAKIARSELAIDSLMTIAGLAYFAEAQAKLDDRIREQLR